MRGSGEGKKWRWRDGKMERWRCGGKS